MRFNLPLVILDCEMSGTTVAEHQIIEIGAYLCDQCNFGVLTSFHSYVGPDNGKTPERVIAEGNSTSLAINNITVDRIRYARSINDVLINLGKWLPPSFIWVGYDLNLDYAFFKKYLDIVKLPGSVYNLLSCRKIDVKQLVELGILKGHIKLTKSMSLVDMSEDLHIPIERAHTALGDCKIIRELFKTIIESNYV